MIVLSFILGLVIGSGATFLYAFLTVDNDACNQSCWTDYQPDENSKE